MLSPRERGRVELGEEGEGEFHQTLHARDEIRLSGFPVPPPGGAVTALPPIPPPKGSGEAPPPPLVPSIESQALSAPLAPPTPSGRGVGGEAC